MADEQDKDELKEDFAGYPNLDGLVQGYRASGQEAKKWREQAEQRDHELQEFRQSAANPRPAIPDRSSDPNGRLTEYGIPVDALEEFVNQRLERALQPIAATFTARSNVLQQYPDFVKFESDVAQYLGSDPQLNQTYQRMFAADPAAAMEYAFLKFGDSRRRSGRQKQAEPGAVEEAAHAAIPSGRVAEGRRPDAGDQNLKSAWEKFQSTGSARDAETYAKVRLRSVIKDEFLQQ